MSGTQLKFVRAMIIFEFYKVLRYIGGFSFSNRLREESLKQIGLIEEIERVRQLALHDTVLKPYDVTNYKKKKEIKSIKRVPISKNTYSSKVQQTQFTRKNNYPKFIKCKFCLGNSRFSRFLCSKLWFDRRLD